MAILLYIAAVIAANVITAATAPAEIGPFLVTWGTWFAGVTFILRDFVQLKFGRRRAYMAIGAALILSALLSAILGDTLAIVVASTLAFAVSESADTEVFTRLRARLAGRVLASGLVGSVLDSVIFCVVGLSPLLSGFVPWSALPNVILGQIIVKGALQGLAAGGLAVYRPHPSHG